MKQYKAVPGPMDISVSKGNTQSAFDLFANIINREAAQGWEYHSMEVITVTEKPGCFFHIHIQKPGCFFQIYVYIFRFRNG